MLARGEAVTEAYDASSEHQTRRAAHIFPQLTKRVSRRIRSAVLKERDLDAAGSFDAGQHLSTDLLEHVPRAATAIF
jgi:hypothetical protein